jgi:hypothetical protein
VASEPAAGGGRPVPVLLISGIGRSGSTLIDRALGAADGCASLGEVVRIWQRGLLEDATCGCGRSFRLCELWGAVGERAFGGWDSLDAAAVLDLQARVDRTRFIPLMVTGWGRRYRRDLAEYGGLLTRLYAAVAEVTGARLVVDSSKDLSTTFLLRTVPGVDVRVVHLVRDSRAVAYSWTKEVSKGGSGGQMDRYAPAIVGMRYLFVNLVLHAARLVGMRCRFVRYEDFVADPATTTSSLLSFGGLADASVGFVTGNSLDLGPHHSLGGNPMRFTHGAVEVRLDDTWRGALPSRDRRIVTTLTWPLLASYRYLPVRRPRGTP